MITFRKSNEKYGAFGNMSGGYPVTVYTLGETHTFHSSEALYQAMKVGYRDEGILGTVKNTSNGYVSKLVAKRHPEREDWKEIRIHAMTFAVYAKYKQNPRFKELLDSTGTEEIVEISHKDTFWGRVQKPDGTLVGDNELGRVLESIRDGYIPKNLPGVACLTLGAAKNRGERITLEPQPIPSTLEEAVAWVKREYPDWDVYRGKAIALHSTLGMELRNRLGLWTDENHPLKESTGLTHPDDISHRILQSVLGEKAEEKTEPLWIVPPLLRRGEHEHLQPQSSLRFLRVVPLLLRGLGYPGPQRGLR